MLHLQDLPLYYWLKNFVVNKTLRIMKTLILLIGIACLFLCNNVLQAQDTLKLDDFTVYVCKVIRITETEVEFKKKENPDGPVYSIKRSRITNIVYENGFTEQFSTIIIKKRPDLLDLKNCVKVDFFAPVFNKITVGYERSHHYGFNSEFYLSFISNQISKNLYRNSDNLGCVVQGVGIKYGAKYLLGNYSAIKGSHLVHPLRGGFFRVDLSFAQYSMLNTYMYEDNYTGWGNLYRIGSLNVSQLAFGFSLGQQAMLGNSFMLQTNLGVGYCGAIISFKEKYQTGDLDYYNRGIRYNPGYFTMRDYGGVLELGTLPVYISGNITLGYVLGKKEERRKIPRPQAIFND
jgi:hypothetical protein